MNIKSKEDMTWENGLTELKRIGDELEHIWCCTPSRTLSQQQMSMEIMDVIESIDDAITRIEKHSQYE